MEAFNEGVTLEQVIDRYISLGEKDPRNVAERVFNELGDDVVAVVQPHLADFIAEMARHRLGNQRRAELARITPRSLASREIMLKSIWIPAEGSIVYKRIADVTADEFEARAAYMERMVASISAHAQWCRDCASAIRAAGVANAGGLDRLPALPEIETHLITEAAVAES